MPVGIRVSSEEMGRQSVTMGRQSVLAVVKKLISKKIHITNYNNGKRRCFSLSISLLQCFSLSISLVSLYFSVYQLTTVNRRMKIWRICKSCVICTLPTSASRLQCPEEATYCQPAPTLLRAASELHHSWPQEFGTGLLHWLPQEPRRASTQDSDSNLEDNIDDIIELFGSRSPGSSLHTSPPSRLLDSSHFNISPFTFSPFPRVSTFSAVSESGETLTFKQKRLQFVLPSSSKRQKFEV